MPTKQITDNIFNGIEDIKRIFEYNPERILVLQTEISDIQHILGLYNHDAVALVKLAKELRSCLRERWRLKNELEILKPVYEMLCKHEMFNDDLKRAQNDTNRVVEVQENRRFSPRVRNDLIPGLLKTENNIEKLKQVMEMRNAR